jgi:DNA-binding SARP family transcriptional activator/predicted negative regulator of RcsB-dependent stress response
MGGEPASQAVAARPPTGAKFRVPGPPPWDITRDAALAVLSRATSHRLTTVVGGAGFGKSTLVASWARERSHAWYTVDAADRRLTTLVAGLIAALGPARPEAADAVASLLHGRGNEDDSDEVERARSVAGLLSDVLAEHPGADLVIVLDDVDEIEPSAPATRFIEALARLVPADLHLILASRRPMPFAIDRLRGQGQLLEIDDELLAFSLDETTRLMTMIVGDDASGLTRAVHAATDGWPAAVVLAAQALHRTPPASRAVALRRLQRPEGPLFAYVAREALSREPESTIEWLRRAAHFERFSAELLSAVGIGGQIGALEHGGRPSVFLQEIVDDPGWYRLHGLIREYIVNRLPLPDDDLRELQLRAGQWFETRSMIDEALQAYAASGDAQSVSRLLEERGTALLQQGAVDRIVSAEASLSGDLRGPGIDRLYGDALLTQGDWDGALAAFRRAGADADELDSGLAWRVGLMQYLRGELARAGSTFGRARLDGVSPADDALVLAWSATASWLHGDQAATHTLAARALEIARSIGDDRSLAAAHTAMALVANLDGDPPRGEAAYRTAREHAERAGDVLQLTRISANLGDHLLERGRYREALVELDAAIRLAEAVGFPSYQALALADRGQAQIELGHFDEALSDVRAAKAIYQRLGTSWVAYAIVREGRVHRLRGDLPLARAAYEDAIRIAEANGDRQVAVPALVGLALTVVDDDPGRADELMQRALEPGHGVPHLTALVGAARIALNAGDHDRAIRWADEAIEAGRARRDPPDVARALQVRAEATAGRDLAGALAALDQARAIWQASESPTGEAWTLLSRARVLGPSERAAVAREAEHRFLALGARGPAAEARTIAELAEASRRPAVAIESLGAFRVFRGGQPVQVTEWQSRKARDLLKMLVARRGRPVSRETLIEALWPDQDPGPLGNRFSVALTTVRTILDPGRMFPADHFVVGDKASVSLDLEHLDLDVVRFLELANAARRLAREGRRSEALEQQRAALALYGGDFLEEDPYEDWSTSIRDAAQSEYLEILRNLAEASAADGDTAAATGLFLRILDRDSYDERAHLGLVEVLAAAGRHGEARRRYSVYQGRMDEIGVEAAAFPATRSRQEA